MTLPRIESTLPLLAAVLLAACSTAYYGAMESIGYHKREILVDRIEDAQESQQEASEQFASALDHFSAVTGFDGGDLEDLYEDLNDEFETSEKRAEAVREHVDEVKDVGDALFREWADELEEYSSASLRAESERSLRDTRRRFDRLVVSMERAEQRIDPVLDAFRDQVLYLKHNLNARAVAAMKDDLGRVESEIRDLIEAMNASMAEAETFIAQMKNA